jgi:hypothetical protein
MGRQRLKRHHGYSDPGSDRTDGLRGQRSRTVTHHDRTVTHHCREMISNLNEQTLYTPARPPGAEPGHWRPQINGIYNLEQAVIKCPRCEHGVIVPYGWSFRWPADSAALHCKGCAWHKALKSTKDPDELAEIDKLLCVPVLVRPERMRKPDASVVGESKFPYSL